MVETLKEVNPSSHMGVPRVWEKIMEKIKEAVSHSAYIKKKLLTWAMSVGLEANQRFVVRRLLKLSVILHIQLAVLQLL